MIIEIPGKPIPLARPRFWANGSKFGARDGQKIQKDVVRGVMVRALREALNSEIKASVIDASKLSSAIGFSVSLVFIFQFPKSFSQKKKKEIYAVRPDELISHTSKPDVDNLIKFYLDCATGIIWDDDCKISSISAQKGYGDEQKTILVISPRWSK